MRLSFDRLRAMRDRSALPASAASPVYVGSGRFGSRSKEGGMRLVESE
jgi:hypothetical protein